MVPGLAIRGGLQDGPGSLPFQIDGMIKFFTQQEEDEEAKKKIQTEIYTELGHMRNQDGEFLHRFIAGAAPALVSYDEQVVEEKKLTLEVVDTWVMEHGGHNGRIGFFSGFYPTNMSQKIATPLLSMKTTGSISVERAAKPLKNKVATNERNRLGTDKRSLLLRVGINLRLKALSLKESAGTIGDEDNKDGDLIYE